MEESRPTISAERAQRQKKQSYAELFFSILPAKFKRNGKAGTVAALERSWQEPTGGGSLVFKGQKFTHHTTLPLGETALYSLTSGQKRFLLFSAAVLAGALLVDWHLTLVLLLGFFTLVYFFDVLLNLFLVYRSFSRQPEINISREETEVVPGTTWPLYTVFCPLYKEWEVLPQFVAAMKKLDYPKDRLQILLLLEEDDVKTIQSVRTMSLPENMEAVIVPHSLPKTKPKAMNYGLKFAKGEYLVVYDAEDIPDPLQLKKAVLAFQKSPAGTVCVQAKLNFYNPKQNLLTKIFTAEYSLWFDLVLPGLQSLDAPIPLGGTSNHFKAADLKKLKGWDAFNVTEDCDLGIRLSKKGLRTAIFNSTTWEEANSKVGNWYTQRSRWIKGYMQTFLVHMRQWKMFLKNRKLRDLFFFQMTVGGKIVAIFLNPLMWAMTFLYFAFRPTVGHVIESFFPGPVLYMGVFALVFGNFFYFYQYMVGVSKRGFDSLVKYTFLVPFYWIGMSLAAWKALAEVIFKPHYWAKTAHGLHLQNKKSKSFTAPLSAYFKRVKAVVKPLGAVSGGGMLVAATVISSFINFLYNALLGRVLTLEQFSILTLFNTLLGVFSIVTAALTATINHRTAYVITKSGFEAGANFRAFVKDRSFLAAGIFSLLWLVSAPALVPFFKVPDLFLGFAFTPVLVFGLLAAVDRGFLQGTMHFVFAAAAILLESLAKFVSAMVLAAVGLREWVALSLPVSFGVAALSTWFLALRIKAGEKSRALPPALVPVYRFPRRFFAAAVLTGLSSTAFLSLDVILAKHFLDPVAAGQYALLSLAGKAIFYFGSMLGVFIVTFTSRDEGAGCNPNPFFYRILGWTALLVVAAWVGLGLFGNYTVPLLFGSKAINILAFLPAYTAAISLFTIANAFVVYHLARKHLLFSFVSLIMTALMGLGLWQYHSSLRVIVDVMLVAGTAYFAVMAGLHLLQRNGRFIIRNLVDLVDAFFPLAPVKVGVGNKRILIFNWRDTKHVFAGGAEVYIHELAKRWVAEGNHVTVFCGNDGHCPRMETVDGVRIIRRGGFYLVYLWAFVYYILQFRGRFDLIIDCQNGIPFFTPLYAKEEVVCLLHHVHQEVFRKYLVAPLATLASVLENRVMPWAYRQTKFITISDSSHKSLKGLGLGQKGVKILHPGVDLSLLRPGQKDKQPLVLYLGRLKAYKSVDVLIKAFKNIADRLPQAKLVIAGSGEEEKNLKGLACSLALEEQVIFTGKITEQEKLSLLQRAWVLVNPSMVEGWGITTIEANACGVPVVAADVPGLRDSVKNPHTGYLVKHGDVQGFGYRIVQLLKDGELRAKMGSEALLWSRNFDWDKLAKKGLKILRD